MFAINHAATALIIKKKYEDVSIVWLLIAVQFMELLWVLFNYLGVERTTTEAVVKYIGDIHLSYVPYSHSIITTLGVAFLAWLILGQGLIRPRLGLAFGMGVASSLVLDLITHGPDIPIAPMIQAPKVGLGLYTNLPLLAFILELGYGIFCWWIYKGSKALLATIIVFNVANLSFFSVAIPGPEELTANRPLLFTSLMLIQTVVTLVLVGVFSKQPGDVASQNP